MTSPVAPPQAPQEPEGTGPGASTMRYIPGLDGLRAVAVLAVLLYHADVAWIPGGFLGVEVFFVISGYLITALLLSERRRTGRIDLRTFWIRRARRLLPALFLVLGATAAYSLVFLPDEVASLRGDLVAAFFYVTNWYLVFTDQSYFEAIGRPSLLRHLWSLAVEEQFYLVWPLLFAAGMRLFGRRGFIAATCAGVVASTLLMFALFDETDPSRVYYGTDTRAAGLLVGALLAFAWAPWRLHRPPKPGGVVVLDVIGVTALVVVVWRFFLGTGEFDPALYLGGFLVLDIVTAVLIAVVVHPAARLGRALGVEPLRWVGLRSYGIYLWHWPVFMLTRPELDVTWPSWVVFVVRFGLTLVLAELSYRFVEMPVRNGVIGRWLDAWRHRPAPPPGIARPAGRLRGAGALAAMVVSVGVISVGVARADFPPPPEFLLAVGADGEVSPDASGPPITAITLGPSDSTTTTEATTTTTTTTTTVAIADPAVPVTEAPPATEPPPPPPPPPVVDVGRVAAVGDSVMLGAAQTLFNTFNQNAHVDAAVGRQVGTGIGLLTAWRDSGLLTDTVIVHLGNNGTFTDAQFDQMMEVLAGVPRVLVLTVKVPRAWEPSVNETVLAGVARHPNAVLVDWRGVSMHHPEWFYDDGMHLRPEGAQAYAELIAAAAAP